MHQLCMCYFVRYKFVQNAIVHWTRLSLFELAHMIEWRQSCRKVMFLHLSVSHSVHRGVSASVPANLFKWSQQSYIRNDLIHFIENKYFYYFNKFYNKQTNINISSQDKYCKEQYCSKSYSCWDGIHAKCCYPCPHDAFCEKSKWCFRSTATINLENGKSVRMSELQVGDRVQTGM